MAHNLTVTPTAPGNVPVPDPGDARTAASVIQFAQPLANSAQYLANNAWTAARANISVPLIGGFLDNGGGSGVWIPKVDAQDWFWLESVKDAAVPPSLYFDLRLPIGVSITDLIAFVTNNGAAHGALPNKPQLFLVEYNYQTETATWSRHITDTSASTAAYDAQHTIDLAGGTGAGSAFPLVVQARRRYTIVFAGEWGANANNNSLRLDGFEFTWNAP